MCKRPVKKKKKSIQKLPSLGEEKKELANGFLILKLG